MPLTYTRSFRVRFYECDANGYVNQANYLRYMQEAAFDATAAAGYDKARYDDMDRVWLVRETNIEYTRPLRYDDRVEVTTWVHDFGRVRSRRAYDFRLAGTGDLVAQAMTNWAFLELSRARPAAIPVELKAAFFPEGAPESRPARERFPSPPPPPPGVFRQNRRVEWRDLDGAGHVNNAVHLDYIEECAIEMMRACGWPVTRMAENGWAIVARQHQLEYKLPALPDDELEVTTWLSDLQPSAATRHSATRRVSDGAQLLQARTVQVWIDVKTGEPIPIPASFLRDVADKVV